MNELLVQSFPFERAQLLPLNYFILFLFLKSVVNKNTFQLKTDTIELDSVLILSSCHAFWLELCLFIYSDQFCSVSKIHITAMSQIHLLYRMQSASIITNISSHLAQSLTTRPADLLEVAGRPSAAPGATLKSVPLVSLTDIQCL